MDMDQEQCLSPSLEPTLTNFLTPISELLNSTLQATLPFSIQKLVKDSNSVIKRGKPDIFQIPLQTREWLDKKNAYPTPASVSTCM